MEPRNILGTIIRQLLETVIILKPLEEKIDNCYRSSARTATETDLLTILFDALQYFTKVYILIDGLDECNKPDLKLFLQFLNRLLESDSPLLKIALFSRENNEIANAIGKRHPRIRVSTDRISLDISSFIKETVESKIACGDLLASPPLKREITRTLVDGAHGMYVMTLRRG